MSGIHSNKSNLQVLYEDNHIIAINKRCGDIVQGDQTGDKPLSEIVKEYLKDKYAKPGNVYLGVVHRLDRPTSGIIIFARTSKALSRMNSLFKERKTQKTYWAIVKNAPPKTNDQLTHWLRRNPKKNMSTAFENETTNTKKAILEYEVIAQSDRYFLLSVHLYTGRHHQIRAQLAKIGCPIKGDLKYGFDRSNPNAGIDLHARSLSFIHPVQHKTVEIIAPPPNSSLWSYFMN
ncbi:RluA family pseudouridine synthase [Ascidiimonas sp. W6]|uniref:RluA family pseudouridine synthase n=1 Tax=Ascidiimonas meishanensis TaxID=3128903 RepID=UPI0030EE3E1A